MINKSIPFKGCAYEWQGLGSGMMDFESEEIKLVVELCFLDSSMKPPAVTIIQPEWPEISAAISNVFWRGGFAELRVKLPKASFPRELSMSAIPGRYRLIALTGATDPRDTLLEWWEDSDATFSGTVRFGDDEWDSRTVCSDISVAMDVFNELLATGAIVEGMAQMRSQWDPKP